MKLRARVSRYVAESCRKVRDDPNKLNLLFSRVQDRLPRLRTSFFNYACAFRPFQLFEFFQSHANPFLLCRLLFESAIIYGMDRNGFSFKYGSILIGNLSGESKFPMRIEVIIVALYNVYAFLKGNQFQKLDVEIIV